ncbi:unnamed protein product [Cutaneotrichosporon oleaginosum]
MYYPPPAAYSSTILDQQLEPTMIDFNHQNPTPSSMNCRLLVSSMAPVAGGPVWARYAPVSFPTWSIHEKRHRHAATRSLGPLGPRGLAGLAASLPRGLRDAHLVPAFPSALISISLSFISTSPHLTSSPSHASSASRQTVNARAHARSLTRS